MARARRRSGSLIPILVVFTILLALGGTSHARFLSRLVSDGVDANGESTASIIHLPRGLIRAAEESCEQTYGFLPCTTTVFGNLFLIVAYGFLMFKAATFLSSGSELLLEILGPGIVGGLFLPILGALPDAMLILGMLRVSSCCLHYSINSNFKNSRPIASWKN
jgi:hypothetical protein